MIIIVSSAKKLNVKMDHFSVESLPSFIAKTKQILERMKALPLSYQKRLFYKLRIWGNVLGVSLMT